MDNRDMIPDLALQSKAEVSSFPAAVQAYFRTQTTLYQASPLRVLQVLSVELSN
jgi:hypothetical protein